MTAALPSLVSALSRRSAIFGAVVVGAMPAAAVAANAGRSRIAQPDPDAELIELGREWQASEDRCDVASDALLEAEERIVFPEPPEALFRRLGDALALVLRAAVHRSTPACLGPWCVALDLG